MLLLTDTGAYDESKILLEVDKICGIFLRSRGITYFQFKRVYRNGTYIILANTPEFFMDFPEHLFILPTIRLIPHARQTYFCIWDETLSKAHRAFLKEKHSIYHGLTILSRRKTFYDCITFAMSAAHLSPVVYYIHILKELMTFAEHFPLKARLLIRKANKSILKQQDAHFDVKSRHFFLPKRSVRVYMGEEANNYITTYEAMCIQLAQEGKSYKEIGSILSMETSTVKTHLNRLKVRTGLSLKEITRQSFHKSNIALERGKEPRNDKLEGTKKHKRK